MNYIFNEPLSIKNSKKSDYLTNIFDLRGRLSCLEWVFGNCVIFFAYLLGIRAWLLMMIQFGFILRFRFSTGY